MILCGLCDLSLACHRDRGAVGLIEKWNAIDLDFEMGFNIT